MTTPNPPSDTPTPVRRQCVGSASEQGSRATRESSASGRSLSYETDALHEPSADAPTSASNHTDAPPFNPGTVWLITDRTRPAWTAALNLLGDGQNHDLLDLCQVMQDTADLAPRTITNHIRSAVRRGWITTRRGKVRLSNRGLIEDALDALDGAR